MLFSECEAFALSQFLKHDSEMLYYSAEQSTAPAGKKIHV